METGVLCRVKVSSLSKDAPKASREETVLENASLRAFSTGRSGTGYGMSVEPGTEGTALTDQSAGEIIDRVNDTDGNIMYAVQSEEDKERSDIYRTDRKGRKKLLISEVEDYLWTSLYFTPGDTFYFTRPNEEEITLADLVKDKSASSAALPRPGNLWKRH